VRQWYEWARGGLFGHAARAAGIPFTGWDAALDCGGVEQGRHPRFGRLLAPKGAEAVDASELEQGVCDTARTDRDDGYLCW
jgi:hypothetical protein